MVGRGACAQISAAYLFSEKLELAVREAAKKREVSCPGVLLCLDLETLHSQEKDFISWQHVSTLYLIMFLLGGAEDIHYSQSILSMMP